MRIVSDNEEPVEPAPDRFKFVVEVGKDQYLETVYEGVLSFAGPLLAIYPNEDDGNPPTFCIPYHRLVYLTKLEPEVLGLAN